MQRVFPTIHPGRRNLTAIRGYVRLGGLPDNPRTDPQDRAWFGPHDRLFIEEESEPIEFVPGPEFGESPSDPLPALASCSLRSCRRYTIYPIYGIYARGILRTVHPTIAAGLVSTAER